MAQKYVVKNEDNPLTLAKKFETSPQAILQNNAIKSLTAGQTIKVPTSVSGDKQGQLGTAKTNGPFVVNTNPLFNQTQTQAQGSFVSGGGQVNLQGQQNRPPVGSIPSNVTNSGYLTQNGQYTSTQQQSNVHTQVPIFGQASAQLTGGSFYSGSGEINLTGVVPGGGSGGGSNNSYSRPTGIYTGGNSANDIAWRNYWNYSAANPSSVESPVSTYMPTRNDIWERKAAQRRRAAESNDGGGSYSNGYQYQSPQSIGNNVVGGSWRVG